MGAECTTWAASSFGSDAGLHVLEWGEVVNARFSSRGDQAGGPLWKMPQGGTPILCWVYSSGVHRLDLTVCISNRLQAEVDCAGPWEAQNK